MSVDRQVGNEWVCPLCGPGWSWARDHEAYECLSGGLHTRLAYENEISSLKVEALTLHATLDRWEAKERDWAKERDLLTNRLEKALRARDENAAEVIRLMRARDEAKVIAQRLAFEAHRRHVGEMEQLRLQMNELKKWQVKLGAQGADT